MLIQPVPDPAAQAAFLAGLPAFLAGPGGLGSPAFVGLVPDLPDSSEIGGGVAAALPVFALGLAEAATNTGVISPPQAGWQFFSGPSSSPTPQVVLGTVVRRPPMQAWKLINVYYGQSVQAELIALNALGAWPQVATADYEPRLLKVPGLNVKYYWLAAQKHGVVDLCVPVQITTGQFVPGLTGPGPYEMPTWLAVIRPLAAGNLTMAARSGA